MTPSTRHQSASVGSWPKSTSGLSSFGCPASGRRVGAITTAGIADAVKAAGGPSIDRRKVGVAQPMKSTGEYEVQVRLHAEVSAKLTVKVVSA